jgi:NAD(P)-dependent dehydrogenase (short-subunit alcohol dehydrogenase family)
MNILIIGGDSDLAGSVSSSLDNQNHNIIKTTRNKNKVNEKNIYFNYKESSSYGNLINSLRIETFDAVIFFAAIQKGPEYQSNQLLELDVNQDLDIFTVNALGPAKLIELFIFSKILAKNAKILVMSSRAGSTSERGLLKHHSPGGDVIYRASKSALNNLIKNISFTYKNTDLIIVAIHPGWVRTRSGGENADLGVEEAAQNIVELLHSLNRQSSGSFLNYDKNSIGW